MIVRFPPLALTAAVAAGMWLIARGLPRFAFDIPARVWLSGVCALAGAVFAIAGVRSFRSAGTSVNPNRPGAAKTLVVHGVYRVSRNPMYLGFVLILLAWGTWLANWPALLLPGVLAAQLNWRQIPREEEALEQLFGAQFEAYRSRVRRWI